ncbi:MAG: oligosaccharide flippase family protein, partial [Planctomycetes bacterium]|nr:oligosaccharide flippase family protein [Planctomycetota bacterium]
ITLLALKQSYVNLAEKLIPLVGILAVFILFTELVKGALMGIGRVDIVNYIFLSSRIIQVVVSIALIIRGFGIWSLYWGNALSSALIFLVYVFILRFVYKIKIFSLKNITKQCTGELLAFGGTMFSARIVSMLIEPFNKVIISRYIGLAEVSYYEIGLRGASQLRSLYEMGLKAIMPRVSELQQKTVNFRQAIAKIHKKSLLFITVFALPAFAGLFILSNFVLSLWLRDRYDPQISAALRWFLFAYIINLLVVPSYYIFMGIGKAKYCFLAHLITSASNITIISLLIAMNITGFSLFIGVQSFSIIISAIVMISLFVRFCRRSIPINQILKDTSGVKAVYC